MGATTHPRCSETLVLGDGAAIRIRPLSPRDRAGVAALFARLSSESRYRRFHGPKRELTDRELVYFTDVDHVKHEALAAVDQRDNSIVGVARYVQYVDRPRIAAVAFEVADDWQRRGIGTALTQRLLGRARINGLDCLTATTRWENVPARALLRSQGFRARASGNGAIEFELTLQQSQHSGRSVRYVRNRVQRPGFLRRALPTGAAMLTAAMVLAFAGPASAATVKVTNQHDSGRGSLRSALVNARDGETILVPAGTYRLKSQLFIQASVSVIGAGQAKTILTTGNKSRVIDINNALSTVTLKQIAVTHGKAAMGGGILNTANLRLDHVAVSANLAAGQASTNAGGGIANSGQLTIAHSQISDNKAGGLEQGRGAGIADGVNGGGSLNISSSSITGNIAQGQGFGGALFFEPVDPPDGTSISITTSTISNNKALGTDVAGGAIFYEPVPNTGSPVLAVTLERDTFSGNVADGGTDQALGGAVFYGPISNTNASLPLTMVNDTFTGNRAGNSKATGMGGAFMIQPVINKGSAALNFTNLTIANNVAESADGTGGGVFYQPIGTFSTTFVNTIIALNEAAAGPDCSQNVPSAGHNVESHTSCGFNAVGDMQNANPELGPLANNGGPTKTLALLPGSPAIDAGSDMGCPPVDQRGVLRPQGPHCDIGAFERKQ